jgi:hypothetical protein
MGLNIHQIVASVCYECDNDLSEFNENKEQYREVLLEGGFTEETIERVFTSAQIRIINKQEED